MTYGMRRVDLHALGAVTCTLALSLLASSASARDATDESAVSRGPASTTLEQVGDLSTLCGEPVLRRLTAPDGLVVWPERMWLSSTNFMSPDGVRYVTMKLALANDTQKPISVQRRNIVLHVNGVKLVANEVPATARMPLRTDGEVRQHNRLQAPEEITVSPGQSASIWSVFAPIPAHPVVPKMSLELTSDAGTLAIDLNELARLKLGLEVETIGPQGCLAMLHVKGHLDAISAAEIAAELNQVVAGGTQRAVIYWDEDAPPIDPVIMNWLLSSTSADERANPFYAAMPKLPPPSSLRELHVARIPAAPDELNIETDLNKAHADPALAVGAALKTLLPWLGYDRIADQLLRGHDWVKVAILSNERIDLPPQALDAVSPLVEQGVPKVRLAAMGALGRINDQRAVAIAKRYLTDSADLDLRKAALQGLVHSRTPGALQTVLSLLQDGTLPESEWVLSKLARAPHMEFAPWIIDRIGSSDPALRQAALRALNRTGHPQSIPLTIGALDDEDAGLRAAAFEVLAVSDDPRAQRASVEYALAALRNATFDDRFDTFVTLISQTRDPRFAPVLLEMLARGEGRSQIISLLGIVGDDRTAGELAARFPAMEADERRITLQVLGRLDPQSALSLAAQSLLAKEQELAETAAEVLRNDGSDGSVALLQKALGSASREQQPLLANSLAGIATPAARRALIRFRDHSAAEGDAQGLKVALTSLQLLQSHSPGWTSREVGRYRYQEEAYEQAIRHLKLAVEIDPLLSEAYSFMGNTYLKLLLAQRDGKNEQAAKYRQEAGTSFRGALELDPYDGQAITGVGIITAMEGKPEQAVQLVTDAAHRCPDDYIFEYNTACVYGRAIEALQKRPQSPDGDRLISEYGEQGIAHLKRSLELGFNQFDLMATDPDLDTLRNLPAFRTLRE